MARMDGRLPLGPVLARFHWLSLFHSEKGIGPRYHGLLVECTTFPGRGSFVVAAETSSSLVDKGVIVKVLPIFSVSSHLEIFKLFNPIWLVVKMGFLFVFVLIAVAVVAALARRRRETAPSPSSGESKVPTPVKNEKPDGNNEGSECPSDIEPLLDFDWRATPPMKLRPFKPTYNITMGNSFPSKPLLSSSRSPQHKPNPN